MKKPNFFIIGAPKCGTSSLYTYLKDHPQIFMSPIKEPNYFNTDKNVRLIRTQEAYKDLFVNAPEDAKYLGEASVWYLYSQKAVPNILRYNPNAKFVVMLRNPIEMAPSLHKQHLYTHEEAITDFQEAWNLQDKRAKGEEVPKFCKDERMLLYGPACKLGEQLERLYKVCDRKDVLVLFLDELKNDPASLITKTNRFLGIDEWLPESFPVVNPATKTISSTFQHLILNIIKVKKRLGIDTSFGMLKGLTKLNTQKDNWTIDQKMRERLKDYFEDDIEKLENLLDINLDHWRKI